MYMKTLIAVLLLGLIGFSDELRAETCPDSSYTLTTDAELDLFEQIGCTEITGALTVGGGCLGYGCPDRGGTADVTSLDGLRNLRQVNKLEITYNSALGSLSGLRGGLILSSLIVRYNDSLTSLDGLSFSESPSSASVEHNPSLSNCEALAPLLEEDAPLEESAPCDPKADFGCGFGYRDPNTQPAAVSLNVGDNAPGCNSVDEILQSVAPPERTLQLILESPAESDTYSGVSTLRGWAVAEEGISKVDIYINGAFFQSAPYGGARGDVGGIFPEIDNSDKSGFALAYNFSLLKVGRHTIKVEAVTTEDRVLSRTAQFQVTRFPASFLPAEQSPDLSEASCVISEQTVHILDTLVDGSVYDVSLKWRTADQGFQIREIR